MCVCVLCVLRERIKTRRKNLENREEGGREKKGLKGGGSGEVSEKYFRKAKKSFQNFRTKLNTFFFRESFGKKFGQFFENRTTDFYYAGKSEKLRKFCLFGNVQKKRRNSLISSLFFECEGDRGPGADERITDVTGFGYYIGKKTKK